MSLEIQHVSLLSHTLPVTLVFYFAAGCWLAFLLVETLLIMKLLSSA